MEYDKRHSVCSSSDNDTATLPRYARLPINRCNLPAVILGSLTFQHGPAPLQIDGVAELHRDLFRRLDAFDSRAGRANAFRDYMTVRFCLEDLESAGLNEHSKSRANANWVRVLRGWSFNSDNREGAILKGWVESRFGLIPRFHKEPLRDFNGPAYMRYLEMRASGLYATNALESQLDLVFSYSQYEYQRQAKAGSFLKLYRGINKLNEHEVISKEGKRQIVLFNNLTSFTASKDRASEFGDYILSTYVPTDKIFFHHDLVPGVLKGEDEFLVIGGMYEVEIKTF